VHLKRDESNRPTADPSEGFFFADSLAEVYNATIGLVVPQYSLVKKMLCELLIGLGVQGRSVVLDIGSGTGLVSLGILKRLRQSRVVSMELLSNAQKVHQSALLARSRRDKSLLQRSHLVLGDILMVRAGVDLQTMSGGIAQDGYCAVVSSFVIHHFNHEEKQRVYQLAYDALRPGGVFINADLFSYSDPLLNQFANKFDIEWIKEHLSRSQSRQLLKLSDSDRSVLIDRWLRHYQTANRLEPIEDHNGMGQKAMLERCGFKDVGIAYRLSLSGILSARKPHSACHAA